MFAGRFSEDVSVEYNKKDIGNVGRLDISIIIINYNTFQLTCSCIESIYRLTTGVTFEVILVDNASTEIDASNFLKLFPQIKLAKSPLNKGFAGGNNLGIELATADYILLLNSDTILVNNVPFVLKQFIENHPRLAAVSGRLEYPNGRAQHNCQRFPSIRYKLFELLRLQKVFPKSFGGKVLMGAFFDHNSIAFPDWIWGTCFMFPRQLLMQLPNGKLADDFFMYGEDIQWCLEFRKRGYRIGFQPDARIVHLMGMSGAKKEEMVNKNGATLMKMYYSGFHRYCLICLDCLLSFHF